MTAYWITEVQPICANARAASDTTLTVEGVVSLCGKIDGHVKTAVFGIAPRLAIRMIVGTAFVDKEINKLRREASNLCPMAALQSRLSRALKTKPPYYR